MARVKWKDYKKLCNNTEKNILERNSYVGCILLGGIGFMMLIIMTFLLSIFVF